ncbi:MAG TPA: fibronectin-binding domain-containing protein [Methanoculleus sp.]|nr:fibronectin-binding domain-containing protein [Methanoculleus sp.]
MATLQGMSGIDVRCMVVELRSHLPLWVGKIYQYDQKILGFRLNGEEKARYQFVIEAGRHAHLTGELPAAPPNPSGFSMLLRKYLLGGKILDIRQHGLERIVEFVVGKRDTTYHLVVELFDAGNVVLCDEEHRIIKPLWHHRFRTREVVPGAVYAFFGPSLADRTEEEIASLLKESDRDLVRTLATALFLGGSYAEEMCRIGGLNKDMPAAAADPGKVHAAYRRLLALADGGGRAIVDASGCWIVPEDARAEGREFPGFHEALDAFYPRVESRADREAAPRLTREERIRRQQQDAVAKFEKRIERLEIAVEAIYENYALVSDIIRTLDQASRERSWQQIETILRHSDNSVAKAIRAIHPAEAAVEVDLGMTVKIFVHDSLEANIGRYYDQIKKFRQKREGALAAMEQSFEAKPAKKKECVFLKPRWYHRFRWCYTRDGVLLLGGRDASQNEDLVRRYMEGGDTFLHADVHGAGVVLVKGETGHMDEAAQFAASYSNAWKAGHFSADVYAARPEQVSKTPEPGEYVSRGSFIVRGERRYFRNVPLGVAIGIQVEPSVAVIGGPVTAVANRAKVWVVLAPGQYSPNDMAKKVLRALRQGLAEEEVRGLKRVLNTEQVAAFVPPGGSDLVELHEG